MIFDGRFCSGFVFSAIGFDVGTEVLRDESFLIAVEVAYVG